MVSSVPGSSERSRSRPRRAAGGSAETLQALCNLPTCRQPFARTAGPGRPQLFCSEACRRAYERNLRRVKARIAHFEERLAACRADLATYMLSAEDEPSSDIQAQCREDAAAAVHRVAGVLPSSGTTTNLSPASSVSFVLQSRLSS